MKKKGVSRRLTSVREVRASIHTHRDRVAAKLEQRPAALDLASPEGGSYSSKPHFDFLDGELATLEHRLVAADDDHTRNLVRLADLRRRSEEGTADVYEKQISARRVLAGTFGPGRDFELAAIEGKTPQLWETLVGQVDQTAKLLREPVAAKPSQKIRGVELDFEEMAGDLEGSLERLVEVRTELQRTQKAADGTLVALNAARSAFDATFPWVAGNVESLFRLAGERELADRVRTSRRRVTRRETEEPGEETAAEAPAADAEEASAPQEPSAETAAAAAVA